MTTAVLTDQLRALGDPTRLRIMQLIDSEKDLCVSELAQQVGISVAGTSQHLSVLESAGLVLRTRDAHRICYRFNPESQVLKTLSPLIHNK
jgi:ArsR family transcriptional regulator, lead/cadmium/zinc/bismuth-responsive transcriptional repressor